MDQKYVTLVKKLRNTRDLTQDEVAQRLGISRTSYVQLEAGKRGLSFDEAEKIANLYNISLSELSEAQLADYPKYLEVILSFLRLAGSKGVKKTKLAKLVYLADFAWYYFNLESMTGMEYRKLKFGPVPNEYFRALEELESLGKIKIKTEVSDERQMYTILEKESNRLQAFGTISEDQKKLIKDIFEKWKNSSVDDIVNFTHEQLPYKICRPAEIIPYSLITQQEREHVF